MANKILTKLIHMKPSKQEHMDGWLYGFKLDIEPSTPPFLIWVDVICDQKAIKLLEDKSVYHS